MFFTLCFSVTFKTSKWVEKAKEKYETMIALAVVSFILNIYIISLDVSASVFFDKVVSSNHELFAGISTLKDQNIVSISFAFIFDFVCFIAYIGLVTITLCCKFTEKYKDYAPVILSLTVLCPLFCIIAHSPYIAVAYLNDGSHASSIFIYYSILIYVFFGVTWLFVHWCDNITKETKTSDNATNSSATDQCCECTVKTKKGLTCVLLFVSIIILLGLVALIACYLVLIPINKAISDAPNRLLSIYQSGGFAIGSFIVFKVIAYFYNKNKEDKGDIDKKKKMVDDILKDFYEKMEEQRCAAVATSPP